MKKYFLLLSFGFLAVNMNAQISMDAEKAALLAQLPLKCLDQEFPNKTSHVQESVYDAKLFPSELHPAFYGCLDWHSSVHGHWSLVRLLNLYELPSMRAEIIKKLNQNLTFEKLQKEADYFNEYKLSKTFERTYGWAWLLMLDREFALSPIPEAKLWHSNMKPLTDHILQIWQEYLPKQTYPNRTGVHPNTAFALCFAIDWARTTGNVDFEKQLIEKAKIFYLKDEHTPAYLEPDGTDFFSPSLNIADLMTRILPQKEYVRWIEKFYDKRSIDNVSKIPIISDRNDYQIAHLDGLLMSRAWNMKSIAKHLPNGHPLKLHFTQTAHKLIITAYENLNKGNYGGDHWLGSFMIYALTEIK